MIVFDVDGTLIDDETADWSSFQNAFLEVAGFSLDGDFFNSLEEVTAQAIVHVALAELPLEERREKELAVRAACLRNMQAAHVRMPGCFSAMPGATELLSDLRARGIPLAIATGDWRETILFKLQAAGVSVDGIPVVTSSEHYSRADIIRAAVAAAGRSLDETVYVGDGVWDLRACRKLGIPLIGVGTKQGKLLEAGAKYLSSDLMPVTFHAVHQTIAQGETPAAAQC